MCIRHTKGKQEKPAPANKTKAWFMTVHCHD